MAVLSAALAFAITMLILSMVNSVFVETVHRFVRMREEGLRLLMRHVYERVVAPYLRAQGLDEQKLAGLQVEFVDMMTVNRAPAGEKTNASGADGVKFSVDNADEDKKLFGKLWSGRRLARLSAEDFMSRLGGSEFGDHIRDTVRTAAADADRVLKDIAEQFEQFGRESSVFFERRARLLSVLCAIVLAMLMHIHPFELYTTYMKDPKVAEAVVKLQDQTLSAFEERRRAAEADLASARKRSDEAAEKAALDKLDSLRNEIQAETKRLQDIGVPIGWTDERFAELGMSKSWWPEAGHRQDAVLAFLWFIAGGLLVGLGSPFWYDMVKSISMVRTLVGGAKSMANTGLPSPGTEGNLTSAQPATPVEHFHTAAAGRDALMTSSDEQEPAVG